MKVALYVRVSTQDQAEHGYSLQGQLHDLREYAAANNLEIVEEITDGGHSRDTLERPGIDRIRELAAAGEIKEVIAWKWDRFGEDPHPDILLVELEPYGTTLKALDDEGEGEMAEFFRKIRGGMAKMEKRRTVERSRNGKLSRARQGEIIPTSLPNFGFAYSEDRRHYEVVESDMAAVRRIFELVGQDGRSIHGTKKLLEAESIHAPKGDRYWNVKTIRETLLNDVYRPHDRAEIEALVDEELMTREVADRLDPEKWYGIRFWNTRRNTRKSVKEVQPDGTVEYKKRQKVIPRPRHEWIAVPVPDSGVPPEQVDTARAAVVDNVRPSRAGDKVWELSGGIIRCGSCGDALSTTRQHSSKGRAYLKYYRCSKHRNRGADVCARRRGIRAEQVEATVWEAVRGALADREKMLSALDTHMAHRRRRLAPPENTDALDNRMREIDAERRGYFRQNARGILPDPELDQLIHELEEERSGIDAELRKSLTAERSLQEAEEIYEFVRDEILETDESELHEFFDARERMELYRKVGLTVTLNDDDSLSMRWMGGHLVCKPGVERG